MTTLLPAYGRDYTSAKAVKSDWNAGKDFLICDIFHPDNGRYINKADFDKSVMRRVMIRYKGQRNVVVIERGKS